MKYKINLTNQLKVLESLFIGSILYVAMLLVLGSLVGFSDEFFRLFFLIYYLIQLIPTILLHCEYYLINRKDVVVIDTEHRTFSVNKGLIINFAEVEKIAIHMTPSWYRKSSFRLLPFEEYKYATIKMKFKSTYIFTGLMAVDLEEALSVLSNVPVERKKRFIASPLLERLFGIW